MLKFGNSDKILRDTKGHTVCSSCGKVAGLPEEKFSTKKYGKILCFNCQKKEGVNNE